MSNGTKKVQKSSSPQSVEVDSTRSSIPQTVDTPTEDNSEFSASPQNIGDDSPGSNPPPVDDD